MSKILIDRSTVEQALEALTSDPNAVVEVSEGRWKLKSHLAIAALRAALAEPPDSTKPVVESETASEPVQEPDSPERRCGGPGCDMTCCQPVQEPVVWRYWKDKFACWEYSDTWLEFPAVPAGTKMYPLYAAPPQRPAEPVQEPVAWSHINGTSDTKWHPPQRKPLAEWQINDLMADIDPEDRDSWSFRQGVYAAEKHHGVRK